MSDGRDKKRSSFGQNLRSAGTAIHRLSEFETRRSMDDEDVMASPGYDAPTGPLLNARKPPARFERSDRNKTSVFLLKDIEARIDHLADKAPVTPPPLPPAALKQSRLVREEVEPQTSAVQDPQPVFPSDLATENLVKTSARTIAFFSAKGGVGTTTVVVHMAASLANLGYRVCVLDLDLHMCGTAFALGIETMRSLADLVKAARAGDSAMADFPMAQHESGFYLLDQQELADVDDVGADGLPSVLAALGRVFDFVLIDGLRDFGEHTIVALDESHEILLVATDEVTALQGALRAVNLLYRLGYSPNAVKLVMNRHRDYSDAFNVAVTEAYGRPIDWSIPFMKSLPRCLEEGRLLHTSESTSADTLTFENLARDLAGLERVEPPKRGLFQRLFKRGDA
ncbi:MAG: AAA family ATPase [Myxococcota bacterium]|nr:AAA family ATPase [Myxococcota bacterium]